MCHIVLLPERRTRGRAHIQGEEGEAPSRAACVWPAHKTRGAAAVSQDERRGSNSTLQLFCGIWAKLKNHPVSAQTVVRSQRPVSAGVPCGARQAA